MLKIRFVLSIVLVIVFSGCSAMGFGSEHIDPIEPVSGDHEIVGVWEWTTADTYIYIFNADGNGSRASAPTIQQFTWEIEDNRLNMTLGRVVEEWYWEINDNTLTITSRQLRNMRYSYNRR